MSADMDSVVAPEPPAELVSFAEHQLRNTRTSAGVECRSNKRHPIAVPIIVQPLDEQSNAVGAPFTAMTRDVCPRGIGLIHTEPIEHGLLALRMTLDGKVVSRVGQLRWCREFGLFYYCGLEFVRKLEEFSK